MRPQTAELSRITPASFWSAAEAGWRCRDTEQRAECQRVEADELGTTPVDRLLESVDRAGFETLRQVRRAVREITS